MKPSELSGQVKKWFDMHRDELVNDLKVLVRCPSVSDYNSEIKPYGFGCRKAVDTLIALATRYGFSTKNYDYHVVRIGGEKEDWENTVGFWGHLDVVPAGSDWVYNPFEPVEKGNFLIGRGVMDNKSAVIGILYMFRCLRDLGVDLSHNFCLFAGCDEEQGMEDISYFRTHYTDMPKINIIADCMFPVCYGEKGILEARLISDIPFSPMILDLHGGSASNMVPAVSEVLLHKTAELESALNTPLPKNILVKVDKEKISVTGRGIAMHSAFPEKDKPNAIHELASFMRGISALPETDRGVFSVLADSSRDCYGVCTGIDFSDKLSGKLTCVATMLHLDSGRASLGFNIRYPISANGENLFQLLKGYALSHQCSASLYRISKPSYFPKEHPIVSALTNIFNDVTGLNTKSYVLSGGTYARRLPNAFGYGPEIPITPEEKVLRKEKFGSGHGNAHGPDECVYIPQVLMQMRIYTLCVVAMNNIKL